MVVAFCTTGPVLTPGGADARLRHTAAAYGRERRSRNTARTAAESIGAVFTGPGRPRASWQIRARTGA